MVLSMRKLVSLFLILVSFSFAKEVPVERILIAPPQSENDSSHIFYKKLLIRALELTQEGSGFFRIEHSSTVVSQGRAVVLLNQKEGITVHRMGTNLMRERELIPIRIPLNKGLLGVRLLLTNKTSDAEISSSTVKQLKKLRACQGTHWPDTTILRENGFEVFATPKYEHMFKLLNHGRCDYFPRSIVEGTAEFMSARAKYPNIRINNRILLSYDFPMYFFVGKKKQNLAERIQSGLLIMSRNGDLLEILENNPSTQDAFPLSKWSGYKIFGLKNSRLSNKTPVDDKLLWLRIPKLDN